MDDTNIVLPMRSIAAGRQRRMLGRGAKDARRLSRVVCALALLGIDILLVGGLAALVALTTGWYGPEPPAGASVDQMLVLPFAITAVALSLWYSGAYAITDAGPRFCDVATGWLMASGILALGISGLDTFGTFLSLRGEGGILRSASLLAFVGVGGMVVLARNALWLALRPRLASVVAKNTAVVAGVGGNLFPLADALQRESDTIEVVAVVPDLDTRVDEVVGLVRRGAVQTVFIVLKADNFDVASPLLEKLAAFPVAVRIVPDITALAARSRGISVEAGLPVLHMSDPPLSRAAAFVKRAEDIVFSSVLLLATAPLMLLASAAIKLESRGPVFFRQPRHGLCGQVIEVIKFRTMYCQCEDRLASRQTARGDPRVTRIGAFLRRHSLDELPQLFNVLGGTMSLVGPRPHAPATTAAGQHLELAVANYMARHRIKPGITGWAQVSGCRGQLDSVEKAASRIGHDLHYIDHWSLLFDLRIIMRTIALVLHDDQAF